MRDPADALTLQLLEWISDRPRVYREVPRSLTDVRPVFAELNGLLRVDLCLW